MAKKIGRLKMSRIPHGGEPNLMNWNLPTIERFRENLWHEVDNIISEAIGVALKEKYEVYAWFPAMWHSEDGIGGAKPEDATTLYIQLPLSDEDEGPTWKLSLTEIVNDLIGEPGDPWDDVKSLDAVRAGLSGLVARLDSAIARLKGDKWVTGKP